MSESHDDYSRAHLQLVVTTNCYLRERISNLSQDVTLHDLRLSPAGHDQPLDPKWAQTHIISPKSYTEVCFEQGMFFHRPNVWD